MSSSYTDITIYKSDLKTLNYNPGMLCWKRFRDDVFALWKQSLEELNNFFDFMNSIDTTQKIKFIVTAANESVLEFLDLGWHINKESLC